MKKVIATLLAVLMIGSLVACSGTPSTNETPAPANETKDVAVSADTNGEDVTIRMWTFLDPTNTSNGRSIALQKMIDRFESENPGVKIVVEPQQWDTMTGKFMAAATTGEAPDIMWCARDELFGVLNAGLLEPLENLFMGSWTTSTTASSASASATASTTHSASTRTAPASSTAKTFWRPRAWKSPPPSMSSTTPPRC